MKELKWYDSLTSKIEASKLRQLEVRKVAQAKQFKEDGGTFKSL